MARVKQTVTKTKRVRKTGGNTKFVRCNVCHGTGRVRKSSGKKK